MKVLVIIPAYNESASILSTLAHLKKNAPACDYIVINDGSTDHTEKLLIENNIKHISLIENLGIGGAVQTGYRYAQYHDYDYAVQLDGDGQHDARYIMDLIAECKKGHNLVIGSRFIENKGFQSSFLRRIGIQLIAGTISLLSGTKVTDTTSGFRAVDKELIHSFSRNYPDDYPESETVMTVLKQGYSVKEIPVIMNERTGGKTSISPVKSIYFIFKVMFSIVFSYVTTKRRRSPNG